MCIVWKVEYEAVDELSTVEINEFLANTNGRYLFIRRNIEDELKNYRDECTEEDVKACEQVLGYLKKHNLNEIILERD